jgi:hypothetical protein
MSSAANNSTATNDVVSAKMGFDAYMYCAYAFLLISYINVNILVFRFWLVMSAIFFIIWGCEPERAVQIDTIVFNSLYIIINIIQSIPLIKQIWPVKLTPLEQEIFDKDDKFKNHMNIRQFKHFISKFAIQTYNGNNQNIITNGDNFIHLFYIAKISPGWKVNLIKNNKVEVTELKEGSWIGSLEYNKYLDFQFFNTQKKTEQQPQYITWEVSSFIKERVWEDHLQTEQALIDGGVVVYKVDIIVCILYNILGFD